MIPPYKTTESDEEMSSMRAELIEQLVSELSLVPEPLVKHELRSEIALKICIPAEAKELVECQTQNHLVCFECSSQKASDSRSLTIRETKELAKYSDLTSSLT